MVALTLPDGSVRHFDGPITGLALAQDIGAGLAKAALIVTVNGTEQDLTTPITTDAAVSIITSRDDSSLNLIRHDCAHVLGQAVQDLFPGAQITFGPAIEDGFYYDFYSEKKISSDDFSAIEKRMQDIITENQPFVREVWSRDHAHEYFLAKGETFKAEHVLTLPDGAEISIYRQGDWLDLCRGPHSPSTGCIDKRAFKLMKVAGAYWRGDSSGPQLQRIYGTAWRNKKELNAYLVRLEEAEKRDHRRLGREMNLFHMQEEAVGSVFWHPNGWTLYRAVEDYIRNRQKQFGYDEVRTPQLIDRVLWEKSGHWEKFREAMFTTDGEGERTLAVKPMNCPAHVQIFKQGIVSYKDLPIRMAEFGCCHRNEPSGALHGIMRVRSFVQDDAHIFCTEDQIVPETKAFCDMLKTVYKDFGFEDLFVKFSDRPDVRSGDDRIWDRAEQALLDASQKAGLETVLNKGEGAFYGPKLEFVLRDAIGRDWQCGTLQADFVLPERLDATYVGEDGNRHRPVILHRAVCGSLERFIGILIENYAGRFPLWLAPVQGVVATITTDNEPFAHQVAIQCRQAGLRVNVDNRNEKINYKVRDHSVKKVPIIMVVGKREAQENKVTIRRLGSQEQTTMTVAEAIAMMVKEGATPGMVN